MFILYSKTCLKRSLKKKTNIGFQGQLSLNAGQKYCRMLQGEHSAILSTFIELLFVSKIFVLSIFEWPLKTGFTVLHYITDGWAQILIIFLLLMKVVICSPAYGLRRPILQIIWTQIRLLFRSSFIVFASIINLDWSAFKYIQQTQ